MCKAWQLIFSCFSLCALVKRCFECRLKKYRLLKDLTQEQLAAQVGVRRETIMRLEKAQYNPSLKLAIDIARVVEAPIEEIFVFK